jgi:hypothetical protein
LTTAGLETRVTPRDLEIVDDWSGNSFPELASLGHGPAQAEVIDSNTGLPVKTVSFSKYLIPEDLDVFPDFNANGAPELAVLGENRSSDKSDKIEIRDLATGNIVQDIWLGAGWRVLEQQLFAGRNRPGSNELAVLKWRNDGARVVVEMRDVESRQSVDVMFFAGNFTPLKLLRIADVTGNGADEVAVFSMRPDSGRQKVQIRDTRSREFLRGVVFDKRLEYQDITTCQDINGNGSDELVFLGRRASDASLNVIVKDSGTGEQIAFLRF